MAMGEKIQAYRKALGISQEELGQRLLVSRQTVSLWEKGQTMPTVDNLIRLKEIFGVSVDAILDVENSAEAEQTPIVSEPIPNEVYRIAFTKEELHEIGKESGKLLYRKAVLFSAFCVFWIFSSIWNTAPDSVISFAVGIFLFGITVYGKSIFHHRKIWKQWQSRAAETVYKYKIYTDYLCINLYCGREKTRESKHYFKDIEFIQYVGSFLCVCILGQLYYIRKSDLAENSFFYSYLYKNPNKVLKSVNSDKWKLISNILFAVSLCSPLAGMPLVSVFSTIETFEQNMWIFYLLTPIPIASIVIGCILKSKGYKYKKNIVVGIIVTVFLCIYGSFTFMS